MLPVLSKVAVIFALVGNVNAEPPCNTMDFKFHVPRRAGSVTGVGVGVDTMTELVGAGVAG